MFIPKEIALARSITEINAGGIISASKNWLIRRPTITPLLA